MRSRIIWLVVVLLTGFLGTCPGYAQDVVNLLANGGFEDGVIAPWETYGPGTSEVVQELVGAAVPEDLIEGNYCLHITAPQGANFWDSGMTGEIFVFESGKKYTLSAFVKCNAGTLQVNFKPELAQAPHTGYPEETITMTDEWQEISVTTPVFTQDVEPVRIAFHFAFAASDFWIDNIRFYEGDYVAPPATAPEERAKALDPNPADGVTNVANDSALSWTAGEFAATHDVYLGKNFDDVNDATRDNPMDVLVSQNQLLTTYQPLDLLEFDQTYYWRIDEVNAPPEAAVYKGLVWSFTVEPFAYPITNITATASSNDPGQGPENTVNGSGLNASDQHSTAPTDMWLSSFFGSQPTWIQYDFDKAYTLLELWIWNSNQLIEQALGVGIKDVTIEYSLDGEVWTKLDDFEFAPAPGDASYTANTIVEMSSVVAQSVRLTPISNFKSILEQYGLSEVRFFSIPVQAGDPSPAMDESDVDLDVLLDWRSGREAVLHDIYFSTDEAAVIDGTAFAETVAETDYRPGSLDYGQIYYWKVNEVNEAADTPVWEGEIWNFSTVEGFVVDDFEGYSVEAPIWESWLDGLGFGAPGTPGFNPGNGTGSAVGNDTTGSTTEETIVNSGRKSMPFFYDNNKPGSASYSETEYTLDQTGNWTERGITELSLWFRGYPGSVGSFVEAPAGTFTMTGSGADIWAVNGVEADEFHYAYKTLTGPGSIVAKVESLQNTNEWAKAGVMIRETLDPDSAHAMVVVTPEQGVSFQRRFETAGTSTQEATGGITAPHWVKIERSMSGSFTASHSTNGTTWQLLGSSQNIQMNSNVHIGLALTAHDVALTCEAVFSNITMTGAVTGQWVNQDIGITTNDPEPMYVALADSTGALGVVTYEDPSATQIDTWTQWSIDMTGFSDQGVNLTGIQKVLLSVGDRTNPVAGGSGKMYFDDITVGNPAPERELENLLVNGGFENGFQDPWYIYDASGGATAEVVGDDPVEGDSCLHVVVPTAGANFYDVGLVRPGLIMEAGKIYTLSAFVKCKEGTLDISFKPEHAAAPYEGYGDQVITVTDQWVEYSVTTPVIGEDVDPAATTFHIGFTPGEFWMDDVKFYEGDSVPPE